MLSALGVVFLYLGAIIEVLDLSLAAFSSLLVVFAVIELGGYWPWLVYLVTGLLALLLLPQKFGAVVYLLFTGYYPMVKRFAESRLPRLLALALKWATFNLSLLAAWGLHDSGESVGAIARRVGIDDPNYFCRAFKQEMGMTPSEYRIKELDTRIQGQNRR